MVNRSYIFSLLTMLLLIFLPLSCGGGAAINSEMDAGEITILSLGDSYTIGEGVLPDERWPVQLASALREEGLSVAEPRIVARTGWTTGELLSAIDTAGLDLQYDLVSLLIGVNNQYRGLDIEEFRKEFTELLDLAGRFAGERVVVLSIPDWGVTPFAGGRERDAIAGEIDAFNRVAAGESERRGITFFDITPISRRAANDTGLLADDGLHPSGSMYALWVEKVLPAVIEMVGG